MLKWRVWFTEKKLAGACIATGFINLFVAIRPKFILWQSSELRISPFSFLGQGTQFFSFSFFFVFIKAVKNKALLTTRERLKWRGAKRNGSIRRLHNLYYNFKSSQTFVEITALSVSHIYSSYLSLWITWYCLIGMLCSFLMNDL